jgi:hypothetical protein
MKYNFDLDYIGINPSLSQIKGVQKSWKKNYCNPVYINSCQWKFMKKEGLKDRQETPL